MNPITVVNLPIGVLIGLACAVRSLATSGDHHDFSPLSGVITIEIYMKIILITLINLDRLDIFVVDRRIIYRII